MREQAQLLRVAVEIQEHCSRRKTAEEFQQQVKTLSSEDIFDIAGYETEEIEKVKQLALIVAEHKSDLKILFSSLTHGPNGFEADDILEVIREAYQAGYSGETLFIFTDIEEYFVATASGELLNKLIFGNK